MTTLTSSSTTSTIRPWVRTAGAWCAAAGLVGVAQAALVLAWPKQVLRRPVQLPVHLNGLRGRPGDVRPPAHPAGDRCGRARRAARGARIPRRPDRGHRSCRRPGAPRPARGDRDVGVRGRASTPLRGNLVENAYAVPVLLAGLGLTLAGIALLRRGRAVWTEARWMPWLVLMLGVYVFFPLSPAISGSFAAGRLAIGGWMLLYAALGYGLMRVRDDH